MEAEKQTALDQGLVQEWITLYELPTEVTRHDSTTVSVCQEAGDDDSLIYLSNAPATWYSDPDLVLTYRRQPRLEQAISRPKSRNLHIRPVFLHDEQRICGLTWLLLLALRVIVLLEFRVRRELAQRQEQLVGLNPASQNQST